jgi:hypothetical protein
MLTQLLASEVQSSPPINADLIAGLELFNTHKNLESDDSIKVLSWISRHRHPVVFGPNISINLRNFESQLASARHAASAEQQDDFV